MHLLKSVTRKDTVNNKDQRGIRRGKMEDSVVQGIQGESQKKKGLLMV